MPLDAPAIWLPPTPAIIRPVEGRLLSPAFLPASAEERRAAVAALIARGVLSKRDAANALVVKMRPEAAMLLVTQLSGFMAGRRLPATVAYVSNTGNTSSADASTYTFTSQTLGGDILVTVGSGHLVSGRTVSSLTANGVSGVFVAGVEGFTSGFGHRSEIWIVRGAGASGSIVVNWSGGVIRCVVSTFQIGNVQSNTATATASSTSNPMSASLSVPAGGIIIGAGATSDANADLTWTNLTEGFDSGNVEGGSYFGSGASAFASASSPTITFGPAGSGRQALILAALR
jgi:hypothetical protein